MERRDVLAACGGDVSGNCGGGVVGFGSMGLVRFMGSVTIDLAVLYGICDEGSIIGVDVLCEAS